MAKPLKKHEVSNRPSAVSLIKAWFQTVPDIVDEVAPPSFTALMVALARREEDPWGYSLIASLEGYTAEFERQLEQFALAQGYPLLAQLTLEDKHYRLLSRIASPFFDLLYAGRVYFVDQCIQAWHQQNRATGKKSVILLPGAGFDSKSLRYALGPDIFIAEFDTAQTQALKRDALEKCLGTEGAHTPGVAYFPVNYMDPEDTMRQFDQAISQAMRYFQVTDLDELSFFASLEGLTYYLDQASNQKLFQELLQLLPVGSQCFVDWYQASAWDPEIHSYGQFLQFLGEPVRFTTDDYAATILNPLVAAEKRFQEVSRADRGLVAAQRLQHKTGRYSPWVAQDEFGQIAQFSLVEVVVQ